MSNQKTTLPNSKRSYFTYSQTLIDTYSPKQKQHLKGSILTNKTGGIRRREAHSESISTLREKNHHNTTGSYPERKLRDLRNRMPRLRQIRKFNVREEKHKKYDSTNIILGVTGKNNGPYHRLREYQSHIQDWIWDTKNNKRNHEDRKPSKNQNIEMIPKVVEWTRGLGWNNGTKQFQLPGQKQEVWTNHQPKDIRRGSEEICW